jgi:hypothetical protein
MRLHAVPNRVWVSAQGKKKATVVLTTLPLLPVYPIAERV